MFSTKNIQLISNKTNIQLIFSIIKLDISLGSNKLQSFTILLEAYFVTEILK